MSQDETLDAKDGRLAENIMWFARALRRAGISLGPGRVADAVRAVEAAGFTRRTDFYWTLHACFVSRPEHRATFHQVFRLFWRDPKYLDHMMSLLSPMVRGVAEERVAQAAEKRSAEALLDGVDRPDVPQDSDADDLEIDIDARETASSEERLRTLDFEQMSVDEMAEAKRMLARLTLPVPPVLSRRLGTAPGRIADPRSTLRKMAREGGEVSTLLRRSPKIRMPNLVVLCDISGSMSQYSRAVLHFVHAVAHQKGQGWAEVHAFSFGTRLTNITRHLQARDVDAALAAAGTQAQDWAGGTRIASALRAFNKTWSRRVLGQGAVVLLITDGLDRDDTADLGFEMRRLSLTAQQVIWLNPLLRWDGFAPKAAGIAQMLPHVTSFRAGHNIASLAGLAAALAGSDGGGEKTRLLAAAGL